MEEEIAAYLERGEKAFRAFKILWNEGLYEDALSRGYYSLIHLCFALLIKNNQDLPKTHSGLIARLWQNKEKLGVDEDIIKQITRIQALRESSDYRVVPVIREDDLKAISEIFEKLMEVLR